MKTQIKKQKNLNLEIRLLLSAVALLCTACNHNPNPSHEEDTSDTTAIQSEDLIIGGHMVTKKSSVAATTISLVDTAQGTLCTASILADDIAITAAHCVNGNPESMQLSFGPRTSGNETRPVVDVAVPSTWSQHQNDEINNGDIALIKFSGGLPKSATAAKVMKASHRLSNGEIVTLAGFGISKADGDGSGRLRTVDVKIENAKYSQTEVSLDQKNRHGACHGDSGGPAFIQDNQGELLLWGITSRGINDPSDSCAGQSVYTKIQPYSRWINNIVRTWKNKTAE